jgi:hypothetical protein
MPVANQTALAAIIADVFKVQAAGMAVVAAGFAPTKADTAEKIQWMGTAHGCQQATLKSVDKREIEQPESDHATPPLAIAPQYESDASQYRYSSM